MYSYHTNIKLVSTVKIRMRRVRVSRDKPIRITRVKVSHFSILRITRVGVRNIP